MLTHRSMHATVRGLTTLVAVSALLLACEDKTKKPEGTDPGAESASKAPTLEKQKDVLAIVNGVPIRDQDFQYVLAGERRKKRHGEKMSKEEAEALLERIIDQELARQAAEKQGLDQNPEYIRKLRFMEAPVNDFKREKLSEHLHKEESKAVEVTDAEARAYFDEREVEMTTLVHIKQIAKRGSRAEIQKAKAALDSGKTFDEVAAAQYATERLEGGRTPWVLGELRLLHVPQVWRDALAKMKAGETSGILEGPGERFWIIQLVERKKDEQTTFEKVKADMIAAVRNQKLEDLEEVNKKKRRSAGKVKMVRKPDLATPPDDHDY